MHVKVTQVLYRLFFVIVSTTQSRKMISGRGLTFGKILPMNSADLNKAISKKSSTTGAIGYSVVLHSDP